MEERWRTTDLDTARDYLLETEDMWLRPIGFAREGNKRVVVYNKGRLELEFRLAWDSASDAEKEITYQIRVGSYAVVEVPADCHLRIRWRRRVVMEDNLLRDH